MLTRTVYPSDGIQIYPRLSDYLERNGSLNFIIGLLDVDIILPSNMVLPKFLT